MNGMVAGFEVDAAWPDARLVVELDSRTFHDTHEAFERDRVRDATLQVAGYRVLRITDLRMQREPDAVMRTIQLLLGTGRV